jgi:hypothetical protein
MWRETSYSSKARNQKTSACISLGFKQNTSSLLSHSYSLVYRWIPFLEQEGDKTFGDDNYTLGKKVVNLNQGE